jgi:hypothetical protein
MLNRPPRPSATSSTQDIFVFIVTSRSGRSLIAHDRPSNATQIYLSKPLTRAEYIFRKLGILVTFLLLITWVPAILLLVVEVVFAGNCTFLRANAYLFPAITVFALVEVMVVSTSMLALSSLSTNSRFVGILYTALIFFSNALYGVLRAVTGSSMVSWISFGNNLAQIGDLIFRVPLRYQTPWPIALVMIIVLVGVSALSSNGGSAVRSGLTAPTVDRSTASGSVTRPSTFPRRAGHRPHDITLAGRRELPGDWAERCGQVHVHEAGDRTAQAEQGHDHGAWAANLEQSFALRPPGILSRAGCILRTDDRARVGDGARQLERGGRDGRPRHVGARDRNRRSVGRRWQEDQSVQQGHAPTRLAVARADPDVLI